jgi:phosphoglycolate phosphatase (TIGR01487 family)
MWAQNRGGGPLKYRAIAVDVDGTLTDKDLILDLEAVKALRELKYMGFEIIICSGNVLPIAYALSFYTGARGPIVAENGGVIYHDKKVKVLANPDEALKAYEHLKEHMSVRRLFTDRWRESEVGFYQDVPVEDVKELLKGFDVLVESSGYAIHIMPGNITKMDGIRALQSMTGMSPDEIIAVGDGDNDAAMIEGCGYGIALANASEKAKEKADFVTEHSYGKGFVEAAEHIKGMMNKELQSSATLK